MKTIAVLCIISPIPTSGVTNAAKIYFATLRIADADPASARPSSMDNALDVENTIPDPNSIGIIAISYATIPLSNHRITDSAKAPTHITAPP